MEPQIKTVTRTTKTTYIEVAGKWRFPISQEVTVTDQQTTVGGSKEESDGNEHRSSQGLDRD